jgi:hypothetical protein
MEILVFLGVICCLVGSYLVGRAIRIIIKCD